MERFYLALGAMVGGVVVALIGWWDSHEGFDLQKFGASVLRSLIAGAVFAAFYELTEGLKFLDILWAFLSGAGFDTGVNRLAGAAGWGSFPLPPKREGPGGP